MFRPSRFDFDNIYEYMNYDREENIYFNTSI